MDLRGGAKYTKTSAIGRSPLSVSPAWKMSGYIPIHMDL